MRYDGQFVADKKHGYGIYKWPDGRQFAGWWYKGKQHGFGSTTDKSGTVKYGLYETGKRLKYMDSDTVSLVNSGQYDVSQDFK